MTDKKSLTRRNHKVVESMQKWKLRKGTNPKVRQEIVEIGQQKLPIV